MNRRKKGFSLVEILVVVLIVSMLAALITPRIVARLRQAKVRIARTQLSKVQTNIGEFYSDAGRLPTESEWPSVLRTAPSSLKDKWNGPYLSETDLLDPWGHPIQYRRTTTSFEVFSYGADGATGGEGENADIHLQ